MNATADSTFGKIFKQLLERKLELSMMTDIPDMEAYAQDWVELTRGFERLGAVYNVEHCAARALWYKQMARGSYRREVEGSFAEIIPVVITEISEAKRDGWLRWPDDAPPDRDNYQFISIGNTLYFKPIIPVADNRELPATSSGSRRTASTPNIGGRQGGL